MQTHAGFRLASFRLDETCNETEAQALDFWLKQYGCSREAGADISTGKGHPFVDIAVGVSPWGFGLMRAVMSGQIFCWGGRESSSSKALFLLKVEQGQAELKSAKSSRALRAGDVVLGRFGHGISLQVQEHLQVSSACLPLSGAGARLTRLPSLDLAKTLSSDLGATSFLSALLSQACQGLKGLSGDEIRPLENSLIDFLSASVWGGAAASNLIEGSFEKNAIMRRAMQLLETQLPDPDLSPSTAAEQLGLSLRYLQKLFEQSGESMTHFIRRRRLERAREELLDPLYSSQSIAEISYRWGFNDSAYFSRAFKELYGSSPSQHRSSWRWRVEGVDLPVAPGIVVGHGA